MKPHPEAVESFIEHLHHLRTAVGNPPLSRLARLSNHMLSRSSLRDHLSGPAVRLPGWEFVADYYTSCRRFAEKNGQGSSPVGAMENWAHLYRSCLAGDCVTACPACSSSAVGQPAVLVPHAAAEPPVKAASRRRDQTAEVTGGLSQPEVTGGLSQTELTGGLSRNARGHRGHGLVSVVAVGTAAAGIVVAALAFPLHPASKPQTPAADAPTIRQGPSPTVAAAPVAGPGSWRYTTGSPVDGSPAVAEGVVYFPDDAGNVYAVDAYTGAELWIDHTGGQIDGRPLIAGDSLYIGNNASEFYAINTQNGDVRWKRQFSGGIESSPAAADGVLYFGDSDNYVRALNAADGHTVWTLATNGTVNSSPAVSDGIVYAGSADGNVYAVSASTGKIIWARATGSEVDSSPAVTGGIVYIGTGNGEVYALNARSGSVVWVKPTGGAVYSAPYVYKGVAYVGSSDGELYAFNGNSGAMIWRYEVGGAILSSPFVSGGVVYVGSGVNYNSGSIYAITISGRLAWEYQTGGEVKSSAAVADGFVYIGTDNNALIALPLKRLRPGPVRLLPAGPGAGRAGPPLAAR